MKLIDFLCGQNWVDQFVDSLRRASFEWSHDKDLIEVTDDYGVDVISESFDWDCTEQGSRIWERRSGGIMYTRNLMR